MRRTMIALLAGAAVMASASLPAEAGCAKVEGKKYRECQVRKQLAEPGKGILVRFPAFTVFLEWQKAGANCDVSASYPYCHEQDLCLLYVEPAPAELPLLGDSGGGPRSFDDPRRDINVADDDDPRGGVSGGDWVFQITGASTATLVIENHAVRFGNGVCWAGANLLYSPKLGDLFK